jgi:putative ABC transport system permease protein
MPIASRVSSVFRALFRRKRLEQQLDEELRSYLDHVVDEKIRSGMPPGRARREARLELGGTEQVKERVRDRRIVAGVDRLGQDLRYGARNLRRSPLFTLAAVLSLGIGIGANTAVFTFLYGFFINPMPWPDAGRLMTIMTSLPELGIERGPVTFREFEYIRANTRSFEGIAANELTDLTITGAEEPLRMFASRLSDNSFDVLGLTPALGRNLLPSDSEPGAESVVILGHGLWQRAFGSDRDILGRTVYLSGDAHTVVGVLPAGPSFALHDNLFVPFQLDRIEDIQVHRLRLLGRLKPGVTIEAARQELNGLLGHLAAEYPDESGGKTILMNSMRAGLMNDAGTSTLIIYAIVSLVLLLACANVANLLLARGTARSQEMAVRTSLGADRGRLIRQLLTESVMLAVLGGSLGIALGGLGRDIFLAGLSDVTVNAFSFDIDLAATLIIGGITVFCGLLCGLVPAFVAVRPNLVRSLHGGTSRLTGSRSRSRLQKALVGFEVGMAVAVLIAAGLMIKSFLRIQAMDLGFEPEHIVHMEVNLANYGYEERASRIQFFTDLITRTSQHPAVESVSACNPLPYIGWDSPYEVEGADPIEPGRARTAIDAIVTPGHFRTLGYTFLSGRDFDAQDALPGATPVVVVSEAFSRLNWPNEDPLGKRIRYAGAPEGEEPWREVIGIVSDTRAGTFNPTDGWFFLPHSQWPFYEMILTIRTPADPALIMEHVKNLVWSVEPDLALTWSGVLDDTIRERYQEPSQLAAILGIFSLLALVMASVGVYGVVAYTVAGRSQEFGVRLAIGARPADVLALVMGQGGRIVGLGLLGGLVTAFVLLRMAESLFFGVSPTDPAVYLLCVVGMGTIALLATLVPAWRATRIDPVRALRIE